VISPRSLTPDVELRIPSVDDAEALADAYARSAAHLAPWEPARPDNWATPAGQRERLMAVVERYENGSLVPFLLFEGDRVVGGITVSDPVGGCFRNGDLGYWIAADATGRGLATRAVEAVVELADTELKLHRLEASTLLHNEISQHVLRRTGFTQVGSAPNYLYIQNEWQDCNIYHRILNNRPPGA
jgi:ribosomal-protein-alanine N-acetyltransferase